MSAVLATARGRTVVAFWGLTSEPEGLARLAAAASDRVNEGAR